MTAPIALQLYTVRDAANQDFPGTMQKVAEMGYMGVETTDTIKTPPEVAARIFRDLGLTVCGAHIALPVGANKNEVLDTMSAFGSTRIVCASQPRELFSNLDGLKIVCDNLNEASANATAHGMTLGYHNHWSEFQLVNGRSAYEIMLEGLDPQIFMEVDVYWAQAAGVDPALLVRKLGKRVPLLHLKDGPADKESPMVAVGEGSVDIPAVVHAGNENTEWLVLELDRCATDIVEAAAKSARYLLEKGLGYGR
jgi:sugar phosphate isomerase/epimerase